MVANIIASVLNYLYQFSMARLLGPSDYGVLSAVFSLIYIFTIINGSLHNIFSRFTSRLKVRFGMGSIKHFILTSAKNILIYSFIIFLFFFLSSNIFSGFLRIEESYLFIMLGAMLALSVFTSSLTGILNGLQKFFGQGVSNVSQALTKLLLSLAMVLLGYSLFGAMFGVMLSALIGAIVSFVFLKGIFKEKSKNETIPGLFRYSSLAFTSILAMSLFFSLDILMVKHRFSPEIAGLYAAASLGGKAIGFIIGFIPSLVCPKVNELCEKKQKTLHIITYSIALALLLSLPIILVFYLFPEKIITIVYGQSYLAIKSSLWLFGIIYVLYGINNILVQYNLAKNNKRIIYGFALSLSLLIAGLFIFTNSYSQIINLMIFVQLILLLSLLILTKSRKEMIA